MLDHGIVNRDASSEPLAPLFSTTTVESSSDIEPLSRRGVSPAEFIDTVFPDHEALDEALMLDALAQFDEHRSIFVNAATNGENVNAMYQPFARLVNSIITGLVLRSSIVYIDPRSLPLAGAVEHAPHGVFIRRRKDGTLPQFCEEASTDIRWDEVLGSVKLKRVRGVSESQFTSTFDNLSRFSEDLRGQVGSWAVDALYRNPHKPVFLGMVVVNGMVEMWQFDHDRRLGSDVLELGSEDGFRCFINFIVAIASSAELGG